jgi:hypothetical protein
MSDVSDKESIQEDLRAERHGYHISVIIGNGGSGVSQDRNNFVAVTIGTRGSGMPQGEDIQRAQPFSFELPMFMSEETHWQHNTTNQDEDSKLYALAFQDG